MKRTTIVILVTVLLLLAYELYIIMLGGVTLSASIWNLNDKTIMISFSFGMICGHFFWGKNDKDS